MELILFAVIALIWIIFVYEFIQSNSKKKSGSKTLTADEATSTQDEIRRARSILKNAKTVGTPLQPDKEVEEILPDPFNGEKKK